MSKNIRIMSSTTTPSMIDHLVYLIYFLAFE